PGDPDGTGRDRGLRSIPDPGRDPQLADGPGLLSLSVLVHLTSAMVVAPAALLAYLAAARRAVHRALTIPPEGGPAPCGDDSLPAVGAAGSCWGYLAAASRALDFLQPGRHTYAMFTGLSLAGGLGVGELCRRLRAASRGVDRFDRWVMAGAVLIAVRMVGYPLV